eukprot:COSAG01_NODE_740_length_13891_cov_35.573013_10_plen_174_part_00
MKKRKYTIYEIEKMTKGQLSKYKLKKAINEGDLVAEYLDPENVGRGAPKFLVTEEALNRYIKSLNKSKQKEEKYISPASPTKIEGVTESLEQEIKVREQKEEIAELKNRIQFLETQSAKMEPLLRSRMKDLDAEADRDRERREIMLELANINMFSFFKIKQKQQLLKRLNSLF